MRILFIGDIFGVEAIEGLEKNLERIKRDNKINLVIANAENVTGGKGLNLKHYQRLKKLGISCFTMGNHTFSNSEIKEFINDEPKIVRPLNWPCEYGSGIYTFNYNDKKISVINLMGRVFLNMALDCPFKTLENTINNLDSDYIIVDMHAEATSEKVALGLDFDGKVSAVLGTHTHVPTADERVLPKGTLYITDVGMTGPLNGVIGNEASKIIERFRTGLFEKAGVEKGIIQFNGVILDFGIKNSIKRIHEEWDIK
jgi:metallophosphoesterase (TIGR00282 family)